MEKGGPTGHCGAIRWGIATGLKSFVDPETIESMRLGTYFQILQNKFTPQFRTNLTQNFLF